MAVDPTEFGRARALLSKAVKEAFAESFEPPIEAEPGRWILWPNRRVELSLEETRVWTYGVPGAGTGNLRIRLGWPYGETHLSPRPASAPIDEGLVKRAVTWARSTSESQARHYWYDRMEAQTAYRLGYEAVFALPVPERERLFSLRERAAAERRWGLFHDAVSHLVVASRAALPGYWRMSDLGPLRGLVGDMFVHGAQSAIDDVGRGAKVAFREGPLPPGVKEWMPLPKA